MSKLARLAGGLAVFGVIFAFLAVGFAGCAETTEHAFGAGGTFTLDGGVEVQVLAGAKECQLSNTILGFKVLTIPTRFIRDVIVTNRGKEIVTLRVESASANYQGAIAGFLIEERKYKPGEGVNFSTPDLGTTGAIQIIAVPKE